MKMNAEKTKVMRISRQTSPVTIMIDQKRQENVESFKNLGNILTNDGRCVKLNLGLPWKTCFQQEENSLYQQIGLKFEEETSKMVNLEHGFVWC